jgi:hypothetical protein
VGSRFPRPKSYAYGFVGRLGPGIAIHLGQFLDAAGEHRRPLSEVLLVGQIATLSVKQGPGRSFSQQGIDADSANRGDVFLTGVGRPAF